MTRQLAWTTAGFAALAVGGLGAVLPLLPTTPFVLLAAYAFGKGSPRLEARLEAHPWFGPAIRDWRNRRTISRRAKVTASVVMALTFLGSAALGLPPLALAIQAVCLAAVAAYILSRPD